MAYGAADRCEVAVRALRTADGAIVCLGSAELALAAAAP